MDVRERPSALPWHGDWPATWKEAVQWVVFRGICLQSACSVVSIDACSWLSSAPRLRRRESEWRGR